MAGRAFPSYADLHRWSVEDREAFWDLVWDFGGVVGSKGSRRLVDGDRMPGAAFFPDAKLNYAENLLRKHGGGDALVFRGEYKAEQRLSWDELAALVSKLQQLFRSFARELQGKERPRATSPEVERALEALGYVG